MPAWADWKYSTVSDLRAGGYGVFFGSHGVFKLDESAREAVIVKVRCGEERSETSLTVRVAAARKQALPMEECTDPKYSLACL